MKKVAIINYGMGNLDSVARAVEECGATAWVTDQGRDLGAVSHIILPGVGAFPNGIQNIRALGIEEALRERVVERGVPLLGICLGMQLLASSGTEGGQEAGLGLIPGVVKRLEPDRPGVRIPHVGWNEIHLARNSPLFARIPSGKDFYFVHSYHLVCENEDDILARTPYCGGFVAAVGRENILGVQFHPEKSQRVGFQLLKNFLEL